MTSDELKILGKRLYGKRWKTSLALDLGIHRATLWRHLKRQGDIHPTISMSVERLIEKKDRSD
jgi:hypothetical protein